MTSASGPDRGRDGGIARLIVRCLENEGVSHVFGLPGEENIQLTDALGELDESLS